MLTHTERRAILEELDLENHQVKVVATFEDGELLFGAVCARGLEGSSPSDPTPSVVREFMTSR